VSVRVTGMDRLTLKVEVEDEALVPKEGFRVDD
jgi:hypothetical protein